MDGWIFSSKMLNLLVSLLFIVPLCCIMPGRWRICVLYVLVCCKCCKERSAQRITTLVTWYCVKAALMIILVLATDQMIAMWKSSLVVTHLLRTISQNYKLHRFCRTFFCISADCFGFMPQKFTLLCDSNHQFWLKLQLAAIFSKNNRPSP